MIWCDQRSSNENAFKTGAGTLYWSVISINWKQLSWVRMTTCTCEHVYTFFSAYFFLQLDFLIGTYESKQIYPIKSKLVADIF